MLSSKSMIIDFCNRYGLHFFHWGFENLYVVIVVTGWTNWIFHQTRTLLMRKQILCILHWIFKLTDPWKKLLHWTAPCGIISSLANKVEYSTWNAQYLYGIICYATLIFLFTAMTFTSFSARACICTFKAIIAHIQCIETWWCATMSLKWARFHFVPNHFHLGKVGSVLELWTTSISTSERSPLLYPVSVHPEMWEFIKTWLGSAKHNGPGLIKDVDILWVSHSMHPNSSAFANVSAVRLLLLPSTWDNWVWSCKTLQSNLFHIPANVLVVLQTVISQMARKCSCL